jgi:hypothetical protein
MALVGILFAGYCMFSILFAFRHWKKAKITLAVLERLSEDTRHHRSFDTDAHARPLPTVAPGLSADQVQR